MRLTRAATRALLDQRQGGHLGSSLPSTAIDELPEDVLLEIFDSCRQTIKQESDYESDYEWTWNSKNGWFKLAHVCQKWRSVVLSSSSRLHLRLLFTPRRSASAFMLTCLPTLPIVVDYSRVIIHLSKEKNPATAALRYPDRVRKIAIKGLDLHRVYREMSCPFPTLETFKLLKGSRFDVPTTMFGGSAPSLRHLHLQSVLFASLSQLLSSTTSLVELNLDTDTIGCPSPVASLLTHLQGMPCLRRLQLQMMNTPSRIPVLPVGAVDVVPLLRLTHLQFTGNTTCFDALAAGLAAPFLQDLEIRLLDYSPTFPHLSRFIGDVEGLFSAVLVDITPGAFRISMLTHSHSIDEPPRRIAIQNWITWSVQIGTAFGAKFTAVEQLFLERPWTLHGQRESVFQKDRIAWRGFFNQFHNVKILRVGCDLLLDAARFLLLNSGEPPLLLLPSLEEIELRLAARGPSGAISIGDNEQEEVVSTINLFVVARQRVGRPVRISWNADLALPSPYS